MPNTLVLDTSAYLAEAEEAQDEQPQPLESLESYAWYRPKETRNSAEALLKGKYLSHLGAFVVRAAGDGAGYVITSLQPGRSGRDSECTVTHMRVYKQSSSSQAVSLHSPNSTTKKWHADIPSLIRHAQAGHAAHFFRHPLVDVFGSSLTYSI